MKIGKDIVEKVKQLNLPLGEYVVVASGLLAALGLREASDMDIAVTPRLFKKLRATGEWEENIRYSRLFLDGDKVTFIPRLDWEAYPTTTENAIETATIIGGIPFLNIEQTILFKLAMGRDKDLRDIELLTKYSDSLK